MKKSLICIFPVVVCYLFALTLSHDFMVQNPIQNGIYFSLLMIGWIISGACVANLVYKKMSAKEWVKIIAAFFSFIVVGIAYVTLGVAGCVGALN